MLQSGIYEHYKGGKFYFLLGVGQFSGTEDDSEAPLYAVYIPLYPHPGAGIIIRSLSEFEDFVNISPCVKRFEHKGETFPLDTQREDNSGSSRETT